jgi:tRNA-binding protein
MSKRKELSMTNTKILPVKSTISYKYLSKLDIRVGTIESVTDMPKSDKLVKLTVDFGDFKRTIIVGLKQERENPKEIEGKQALFVVNLEPRKMMGETSEGMLFDIGYENKITPVLAMPEKKVPNGVSAG